MFGSSPFAGASGLAPAPVDPPPTSGPGPYLPPDYFPPDYFGGGYWGGVIPEAPPARNDEAAFDDIVARLESTGQFEEAKFTTAEAVAFLADDQAPYAAVVPVSATDSHSYDDGTLTRTVSYRLVVSVRDNDPAAGAATLGRLESAARNALAGKSYGGFTLYSLSLLSGSVHPKVRMPEQRAEISGSFAYIVETPGSHDETDSYNY